MACRTGLGQQPWQQQQWQPQQQWGQQDWRQQQFGQQPGQGQQGWPQQQQQQFSQQQPWQQQQQFGQYGQQQMTQTQLPQGVQQTQSTQTQQIASRLADLTDTAISKGDFNDLRDYLSQEDQQRLDKVGRDQLEKLNGRIAQIQNAWRDRYGNKLAFNRDMFQQLPNVQIVQGEITQPRLLSNWPVPATGQQQGGQFQQQFQGQPYMMGQGQQWQQDQQRTQQHMGRDQQSQQYGQDQQGQRYQQYDQGQQQAGQGQQMQFEQGTEVAVVNLPAQQNQPPVTVSMVRQGGKWRVDVPDNVTTQSLHDKLLTHLTYFGENQNNWPANEQQAKGILANHILLAINGVDITQQQRQQMGW